MGKNGITSMGMSLFTLMKRLYIEPQKKKFKGVMIGAIDVVIAVNETDNTILPSESEGELDVITKNKAVFCAA